MSSSKSKLIRSNSQVPEAIKSRQEFHTSGERIFSRWRDWGHEALYVVYSYGLHFPILVYDGKVDRWFINRDKYSRTTARHLQLMPQDITSMAMPVDTDLAINISAFGFNFAMVQKAQNEWRA